MTARLLAALFALAALPAAAHHAFSAEYDIDQPVTLTGTLTKIEWINPHGWVYVDVKDAGGKAENWAVEFGGPNALLRRGVRKTDFPIGGEVTVKGYRAKSGKAVIAGTTVKLPDGRDFFAGSEGTGNPDDPAGRQNAQ
ncbi:MAG TPA: DUF6152 family protein [Magnetospirillaceae bacterium]|nr:DUF6152 family protein [Magnetospirillaceae bacterium]